MAATLSDLRAQLAALKEARNSGVLASRVGNDSVQYRSLAEMNQAIMALEAEIANYAGRRRYRTMRFYTAAG